jgi:arylsulfatase A-like enzyme
MHSGSASILLSRLAFCLAGAALASPATTWAAETRKPNIVFVLADDLGWGDLGCYGQKKIRTPHLDRLAAEGMRFTQHYAGNAVCAPSRCVLLTGEHPGHAWIRNNREVQPEGQPPLPASELTIAKLLQMQGYATGAFGKWGLGFPGSEGDPLRQGFDRFFGYNCQRHAHNYYPTSLWDNARRVALSNRAFSPHQKLPPEVDPDDPASYRAYAGKDYAPDLILTQALRFIRDHKERPFFVYFATTVPHLALQVPSDSLAEYQGRWADSPYPGTNGYLPHFAPRAAYAAMVTRLDRDIGRIMAQVRDLGLDGQTLFVFTSDNGPLYDRLGGTDSDFFESAGRLRGRKGSLYEGGVRVPMIARWPGRIAAGSASARVTGFEDWLPTLLELAGAQGATPDGIDGLSFAPTLLGRRQEPRPFLYREFPGYGGQQSVRIGDWKGVRQQLNAQSEKPSAAGAQGQGSRRAIELYDLEDDPGETKDVSADYPELVLRMERLMREQHRRSELFPFPALDGR